MQGTSYNINNTTCDKNNYPHSTEPDDVLKCLICHEVAKDRGKLFCEKCIEKYGMDKPCPHCRMEQPLYFKDNKSELRIPPLKNVIQPFSLVGSNITECPCLISTTILY